MSNTTTATILAFRPKSAASTDGLLQDSAFRYEYVSLEKLARRIADRLHVDEAAVHSMLGAKYGISAIGLLPMTSYKAAMQYLIDLHSYQKYGRAITAEDHKIIDTVHNHIYDAWEMLRKHFNRTPEQTAELMINAIKSCAELDNSGNGSNMAGR